MENKNIIKKIINWKKLFKKANISDLKLTQKDIDDDLFGPNFNRNEKNINNH